MFETFDAEMEELRERLGKAFDDLRDGKITIKELREISKWADNALRNARAQLKAARSAARDHSSTSRQVTP